MQVVIVGGGIAGLSCAWSLVQHAAPDLDLNVRLVEPDAVGGRVRTLREDGFVFEWGPHGVLDDAPATTQLISELGLADRFQRSRESARRRSVLFGGALGLVPTSPSSLLRSRLLPILGRARLLKETIVGPDPEKRADESVAAFARRRFGEDSVPGLFEPLVTGVFAGDVERLSVRSAFPKLDELEREHGSVIKGAIRLAKERRRSGQPIPTIASFPTGMQELPDAIAARLPAGTLVRARAISIARDGNGFALDVEGDAPPTIRADVLVLAVPSPVARGLVDSLDPDLGSNLGLIPHASIAVSCLTYARDQVGRELEAFGFLCARREQRRILGCIFASSVFAGHAPEGMVSLRVLLGGVHRPDLPMLEEAEIAAIAHEEVAEILSIHGAPERSRVFRHPRALPQYNLGHGSRLAAIDGALRRHPNLYVTGAAYRGVSVNDCILNGRVVAGNIARHLLNEGAG